MRQSFVELVQLGGILETLFDDNLRTFGGEVRIQRFLRISSDDRYGNESSDFALREEVNEI